MRSVRLAFCVLVMALATGMAAHAVDSEAQSAIERATARFERVRAMAAPSVDDTLSCVKAQNDALDQLVMTRAPERPLLLTQKAVCYLIAGLRSRERHYFELTVESLSNLRTRDGSAPLLKALSAIAQIDQGGGEIDASILASLKGVKGTKCLSAGFIGSSSCESIVKASRLWLGFMALREGHGDEAAKEFAGAPDSPWNDWLKGVRASEEKRWPEAQAALEKASAAWSHSENAGKASLDNWLAPKPPRAELYARLSVAQFLAGNDAAAIPNLDIAIAERPADAYLILLRARAREGLGLRQAAMKDYSVAAKAAAGSNFYPAVASLRAGDFARASQQLAAGDPAPDVPPADVEAWRALAQSANGSCLLSPDNMEALATSASRAFPQDELTYAALECRLKQASTMERLLALNPELRSRFGAKPPMIAARQIAEAYTQMGVQAEDKKDAYMAVIAYRRALEWDPESTKARFNLAAVYIGDLKFDLAEQQYRALLAADPQDHEAQYWLALMIIGQRPGEIRKAEACDIFRRSLTVADQQKRDQFASAMRSAGCSN